MLSKPILILTLIFTLGLSSEIFAEDTPVSETPAEANNEETLLDSDVAPKKVKFGSKLLKGITSLFSLNNDDNDAALEQAQTASNELFQDIQALKADAIDLNAELRLLEEELLFPVNTQISVFVSLATEELFQLESIRLTLDGQLVNSYLYREEETISLARGGMQRLHTGNLGNGPHELTAVFTGVGPSGRDYERATSLTFDKQSGAQYIELQITDSKAKNQPEFKVVRWQ